MQIVGYDAGAAENAAPALLVATDGVVQRRELTPGVELSYSLGRRRCAGTIDGERHAPCSASAAPYCDRHADAWVCARCTGTCLKPEMDCQDDHALYLAAFAPDTFKVGVTKAWRVETRLREQGADRAVHLRTLTNGRIAREIEADLARRISDRVRVPEKIAGFHRSVDDDAWERRLAGFDPIDVYHIDYGLDLDRAPVPETIATGTVRGTKGRVLVLSAGGTDYAVDMRDLVGHELEEGSTDRELQSSLGAFS